MLFSRRKKLEALAAREAAGENLWTDEFDEQARNKLVLLLQRISEKSFRGGDRMQHAQQLVLQDVGAFFLYNERMSGADDLLNAMMNVDTDTLATILEALFTSLSKDSEGRYHSDDGELLQSYLNVVLTEHRISFEMIDGRMVEFRSKELHSSIVEPTLRLLSGKSGWEGVEASYQKALLEIGDDPADSITDAGTALQEALTLSGLSGNQLGKLGQSAVNEGLLAGHDRKLVDWVAADRSETGDAHNSRPATDDDAWLTVHVVGALILRLSRGTER